MCGMFGLISIRGNGSCRSGRLCPARQVNELVPGLAVALENLNCVRFGANGTADFSLGGSATGRSVAASLVPRNTLTERMNSHPF